MIMKGKADDERKLDCKNFQSLHQRRNGLVKVNVGSIQTETGGFTIGAKDVTGELPSMEDSQTLLHIIEYQGSGGNEGPSQTGAFEC